MNESQNNYSNFNLENKNKNMNSSTIFNQTDFQEMKEEYSSSKLSIQSIKKKIKLINKSKLN